MLVVGDPTGIFPSPRYTRTGYTLPPTPGSYLSLMHAKRLPKEYEEEAQKWLAASNNKSDYTPIPAAEVRTTPWKHQIAAFNFLKQFPGAMLVADMGTGKTKVAIDLAFYRKCKTVLVVCPLSVCQVWASELRKHAWGDVRIAVLDKGTTTKRAGTMVRIMEVTHRSMPAWIIVNYDMLRRRAFLEVAAKYTWDMIIADESHRIKTHSSQTHKALIALRNKCKYRLAMTGTPIADSPLDIWGQMRFVDPGVFGEYWTPFCRRYAVYGNPVIPQMVTGYRNLDDLGQRFSWLSIHFSIADVHDLPEVSVIDVPVTLSAPARNIYSTLMRDFCVQVKDLTVSPTNAIVRLLRLQQVTSGYLVDEITNETRIIDKSKRNALQDFLSNVNEPVVVFCRFIHDIDAVREVAQSLGREYGEVSGRCKTGIWDGKLAPNVKVVSCQIQAGSLGVDMTAARIAVFYSTGFSLTDYSQAVARLVRYGQTRPVLIYRLVATNTVDEYVCAALERKADIAEYVTSKLLEKYEQVRKKLRLLGKEDAPARRCFRDNLLFKKLEKIKDDDFDGQEDRGGY